MHFVRLKLLTWLSTSAASDMHRIHTYIQLIKLIQQLCNSDCVHAHAVSMLTAPVLNHHSTYSTCLSHIRKQASTSAAYTHSTFTSAYLHAGALLRRIMSIHIIGVVWHACAWQYDC